MSSTSSLSPTIVLPASASPRASIIILGWRQVPPLASCLRALAAHLGDAVACEVVIVLNGAAPPVVDFVMAGVEGAVIARSDDNLGFGGGCNLGASIARGEYLVFLNDDTEIEPQWLEALVRTADANPHAAAVGSRMIFPDGSLQEAGSVIWSDGSTGAVGFHPASTGCLFDFVRGVDYCSACSLLVRRSVWDAIGGLDEDYYPAYYEDADFCLAARERGHAVLYEPRSQVRHAQTASSSIDERTFFLRRGQARFRGRWADRLHECDPPAPASRAAFERSIWRGRGCPTRLLVIDDRVPAAHLGSGFGRMSQVLSELSSTPLAITFHPTDHGVGADPRWLQSKGIGLLQADLAEFEAYLSRPEVGFDAVLVSRPHNFHRYAPLIRRHQPQAALIYDAEALFFRRTQTQARLCEGPERAQYLHHAREAQQLERGIAAEADRVVSISRTEAAWFRAVSPGRPVVFIRPFDSTIQPGGASLAGRVGVLFVAGWLPGADSPNGDGLRWFADAVWPQIRNVIPDARLFVTGNLPEALNPLLIDGIVSLGLVDDLANVYASTRVAIAPIRYGAGIKLKVVEALQHRVPTVATSIGAEGIRLRPGALAVADRPDRFADAVIKRLADDRTWHDQRAAIDSLVEDWRRRAASSPWYDAVIRARERLRSAQVSARTQAAVSEYLNATRLIDGVTNGDPASPDDALAHRAHGSSPWAALGALGGNTQDGRE